MYSKLTLELLNSLSAKEFHTTFGNVVECHPEAAVACSEKLPFASVDAVIATFDDYLQQLNVETKTRVLRSFPDLAGKLLDSHQLTEESTYEHACAGLDKLMAEDQDKLTTLNRKYQDKFGFPFVICAREASRFEAILKSRQEFTTFQSRSWRPELARRKRFAGSEFYSWWNVIRYEVVM